MAYCLNYNGIKFDDYVTEDELGRWSQICEGCRQEYIDKISDEDLELEHGYGICGVSGCENEAEHYIDLNTIKRNGVIKV